MHDLGGLQGFGPVVTEDGELTHHDTWELRAQAIAMTVGGGTVRPWIERIEPARYLAASYYERWLLAAEHSVIERDVVPADELARWRDVLAAEDEPPARHDDPGLRASMDSFMTSVRPMPPASAPCLQVGDVVRVSRMRTTTQNRCPRYVRGAIGRIESICGDDRLPGERERTGVVYTVEFSSADLWGTGTEPPFSVLVDLFEDYLERIEVAA